jgi:tetratricopeptide (TPR) repeat protein
MTVEVYIGKNFHTSHERDTFGRFLQEMVDCFEESEELYIVAVEPEINTSSLDLFVITERALITVELKRLSMASDKKDITLQATESAPWKYLTPASIYTVGGSHNTGNPYRQVNTKRHRISDWLRDHSAYLPGGPWPARDAGHRYLSWVVLDPGFNPNTSTLDLPFDRNSWFKLLSLDQLRYEIGIAAVDDLFLRTDQMRQLAELLGARTTNLKQYLPSYTPPAPHISFFNRQPLPGHLIGRQDECTQLLQCCQDPAVKVTVIEGFGGSGKTELAAWLCQKAASSGQRVLWVDCPEREVTDESFLAAIAADVKNPQRSGFIIDKEKRSLSDRMDAALSFLEEQPTLIVLDDFHKIKPHNGIDRLLNHLVKRSQNINVLITTRDHPACLDNPAWPPGVFREITISGLQQADIAPFFALSSPDLLTEDQVRMIYERTSGNPRAMNMLRIIMKKRSWSSTSSTLPLYTASESESAWFASLMEVVTADASELAFTLSVVRGPLSQRLIAFMGHQGADKAAELVGELLEKYILQPAGPEHFALYEFVREYLCDQLPEKKKTRAHKDAGRYFSTFSSEQPDQNRAGLLYEAVYHLHQAKSWEDLLPIGEEAFQRLVKAGDWDRAQTAALCLLDAARAANNHQQQSAWLVRIADRELDQDRIKEAGRRLQEALDLLPKLGLKADPEQKQKVQQIEAHIQLQKGRLAYAVSDFATANRYFDRTLEIARILQDGRLEADCLVRIGRIERQQGHAMRAEGHFQEAARIAEQIQDQRLLVEVISHLGLIARKRGSTAEAQRLFEQAYHKAVEIGDKEALEINRSLLGDLALRARDYARAALIFRECLEVSRQLGNGKGIRVNLGQLGETLIFLGAFDEAQTLLSEAWQRCEQAGDGIGMAWTLKRSGQLAKAQGKIEEGDRLIHEGMALLETLGNTVYLEDFKAALGPVQVGLFTAGAQTDEVQPGLF